MRPLQIAWQQALASLKFRAVGHGMSVFGVILGSGMFGSVQAYRMALAPIGISLADSNRLEWFSWMAALMALFGIGNQFLLSVTARFREIGTLKCLGASNQLIGMIYAIESLMLGSIGAVVGGIVGPLLGSMIAGQPSLKATPLAFSVGLSIAFLAIWIPISEVMRLPATSALKAED